MPAGRGSHSRMPGSLPFPRGPARASREEERVVKKILLGGVAIFVAWEILGALVHRVILGTTYASVPNIFRSPAELKMVLLAIVTPLGALAFAAVYACFVSPKSPAAGVKVGVVWGFGAGVMMGYGSFGSMPIPCVMALVWFLGTWLEFTVAGLLAGLIVKPVAART